MDTNNLMEQIFVEENLKQAYLQVVRNKGARGEWTGRNTQNIKVIL